MKTMTPLPRDDSDETLLWRGTSSQWTNFGVYLFALLLAAAILAGYYYLLPLAERNPLYLTALAIPALIILVRWIATHYQVYEVTTERIKIRTGLFSRRSTELELYRVRDYSVIEPFWLRIVGCGHVVLATTDRTNPELVLHAVPHAARLKDQIRANTERMRVRRGVRDIELGAAPIDDLPPAAEA